MPVERSFPGDFGGGDKVANIDYRTPGMDMTVQPQLNSLSLINSCQK